MPALIGKILEFATNESFLSSIEICADFSKKIISKNLFYFVNRLLVPFHKRISSEAYKCFDENWEKEY